MNSERCASVDSAARDLIQLSLYHKAYSNAKRKNWNECHTVPTKHAPGWSVSSAVVSTMSSRPQGGLESEEDVKVAALAGSLKATVEGPWLYAHCLHRVFSSNQADSLQVGTDSEVFEL